MERYSPLYGNDLSNEIQNVLTSGQKEFKDVSHICQRVRFLYAYSMEISGFVTSEYFDVVK